MEDDTDRKIWHTVAPRAANHAVGLPADIPVKPHGFPQKEAPLAAVRGCKNPCG